MWSSQELELKCVLYLAREYLERDQTNALADLAVWLNSRVVFDIY